MAYLAILVGLVVGLIGVGLAWEGVFGSPADVDTVAGAWLFLLCGGGMVGWGATRVPFFLLVHVKTPSVIPRAMFNSSFGLKSRPRHLLRMMMHTPFRVKFLRYSLIA